MLARLVGWFWASRPFETVFQSISGRLPKRGWSGGAMVLGKLPVPGRPTIWITVGQGPTALAVGSGGGCLDIFTLIYPLSPLSPSLWETARYRLKYCLKGPLNPKQPTNRLPKRQRKIKEMIDEKIMSKQPLPTPTASAVGPRSTTIKISRTPWHWKFAHHRTNRPPQRNPCKHGYNCRSPVL